MSRKTTTNLMRAMGATLAVCSAAAFMSTSKSNTMNAKKTMKKTIDKVAGIVDTMSSFM